MPNALERLSKIRTLGLRTGRLPETLATLGVGRGQVTDEGGLRS